MTNKETIKNTIIPFLERNVTDFKKLIEVKFNSDTNRLMYIVKLGSGGTKVLNAKELKI